MDRGKEHVRPVIENRLRAIAVMIVHVEHRDPRHPGVAHRLRGNRGVVEVAEAPIARGPAWWPGGRHRAKAARSPPNTAAAPVSAQSALACTACHVPAVIGTAASML
jgi:hypothetical protein